MKASELIEALSQFPPDMEVGFHEYTGSLHPWHPITDVEGRAASEEDDEGCLPGRPFIIVR